MARVCIPQDVADRIKVLAARNLPSAERQTALTEILGNPKHAADINKLYEQSLLLRNQDLAQKRFLDSLTGVDVAKKEALKFKASGELARKRMLMYNMDGSVNENFQALAGRTEDEINAFAQKIYDKKYNVEIPDKVIADVVSLKDSANEIKKTMENTPAGSPERMAYGMKIGAIQDIVGELKNPHNALGPIDTMVAATRDALNVFSKENGILGNAYEAVSLATKLLTSAVYKSVQASFDMSYALRQGFKVATYDNKIWGKNMAEAFKPFQNITDKVEQQKIAELFRARVISDPHYQTAMDAGLDLGVMEDFFPTHVAEKIPVLGNVFKASNEAFTIFVQGARFDMYKKMAENAMETGVKITPELQKDMAKLANSLSGRGSLGPLEKTAGLVNKIFYSGRYIRSQLDMIHMPFDMRLDPFVRRQAQIASAKNLGAMASLMFTASLFTEVETDPRSTKFGKAKVPGSKDTWIDLTAGFGSYVVLEERIRRQESKSAATGKVSKLNTGKFGAQTTFDVATNWAAGKLAPAPSALVSFAKGMDYSGQKPTLGKTALNVATPISIQNIVQTWGSEDAATTFLGGMFDVLGASETTYSARKK